MPRLTAGRAISALYQRSTWGKSESSTLWRGCRHAQPRIAKSATDSAPATNSRVGEAAIQHAVEPSRLRHKALQAVGAVLFVLQRNEVMNLPRHRPKAAHLPHQPFIDGDALDQRRGQELAGLLAEIEQDRAGLEYADALAIGAVGIDDRRNLVVGADREEIRRHLLALGDIHRENLVRQPHLFQRDTDLAAVRRVPGVKFDRHFCLIPRKRAIQYPGTR